MCTISQIELGLLWALIKELIIGKKETSGKRTKGKVKSKYVSNDVTIDIIETITLTRKENKWNQ